MGVLATNVRKHVTVLRPVIKSLDLVLDNVLLDGRETTARKVG
jgi:hypothetical protein